LFTGVGSLEYYRIYSLGYIQCQVNTTSSSSSTFDQIVVFWLATSFEYVEHMQVIENCRAKFCFVPRLTCSSTVNCRRGFRSYRLRVADSRRLFPKKHIIAYKQRLPRSSGSNGPTIEVRNIAEGAHYFLNDFVNFSACPCARSVCEPRDGCHCRTWVCVAHVCMADLVRTSSKSVAPIRLSQQGFHIASRTLTRCWPGRMTSCISDCG
jgi:hypothetical protein